MSAYDVVVIGAGVHGASLAFHLARRGARVAVLERKFVAAGATGRSSGLVRMHYDLRLEAALVWASYPYFRHWDEMVGAGDCGFVRTGFLRLVPPAYEDALRANVRMQQELGIPTLLVRADDVRRLAPYLRTDDFRVAAYEPESGYADPPATAQGFLEAARQHGAVLRTGAAVERILTTPDGSAVQGVRTADGATWAAEQVVLAAGPWAPRLAATAGLDLPLTTWSHDVMFVRRPAGTRWSPADLTVIDDLNEMYFRPERGNLTLVGLEVGNPLGEDPDTPTEHPHPGFVERAVAHLTRRVPALLEGSLHSAHRGYDGLSEDQRAILGPAGPDGLWLNVGHSGTGFKIAPAVGRALSEWMLDGAPQVVDIRPFALERFTAGRPLRPEHPYADIWR
ncbi:MAG: FAD-binding oxidoreductase [Chloroflexi bacterium]|nr:FAD-binding oxidoreductase [Chloroflexota bacterium]